MSDKDIFLEWMETLPKEEIMSMIQSQFFKQYQCPECNQTASFRSKDNPDTYFKFNFTCKCTRLKLFPNTYGIIDNLLICNISDNVQWIFFSQKTYTTLKPYKYNFFITDTSIVSMEQIPAFIANPKYIVKFDYIPSFVFRPINEMIKRVETIITFQ